MNGTKCWLNFKQRNSNFSAVLIFVTTFLAWAKIDASVCKQGWVEWNNICYILKQNSEDWKTSQSNCVAEGANLASIGSEEEYIFVLSLLHGASVNQIWIGLNDNDNEGQFQWVDKSPLVFTNLSNDSPNTVARNCIQIKAYKWSPQYCALGLKALCKYVPIVFEEDFSFQVNFTRQQLYTSLPHKLLLNHVLSKKSVPSLLHCTLICLRDAKCMSLNYRSPQNSQVKNGLCILHSATADEFPEDFVDNSVYIYALPIK
ncbi:lectin BRA-3-like [Actinia tenebrosa]|uniref:Lectin BRA-3-like n=1 Tax=Actinia tenebrosa TaxID=6105 RepID=A0A6P8IBC1_ACTTE|nr:lectin BRA-3-like [Actinia tenebrosa]